jgi:hypothetical protein
MAFSRIVGKSPPFRKELDFGVTSQLATILPELWIKPKAGL